VVVGEGGHKKALAADEGRFDPRSIPLKKWKDHENELWETNSAETKITEVTAISRRSQQQHQQQMMAAAMSSGLNSGITSGMYSMGGPPMQPMASDANSMLRYSQSQQFFRASSILPGNTSVYSEPHQSMMMYPTAPASNNPYYASTPMMNTPSQFSYQQQQQPPPQQSLQQPMSVMDIPDEDIQREVQRITTTADLMTMTKKQVREQLGRHYGMDMTPRKDFINYCIEEALRYV
jgi:chitin synthase